ncbi:MAG: glycosyltransferase [Candidatus Levybacteria bacterium]|nr:glycosyltransferase [Candidatus Levybacteria bacterium]
MKITKKSKIAISTIIVNYKVEKEVLLCVSSILRSKIKEKIEIIVVDNDKGSNLERSLAEKYPGVKYVMSPRNLGYGAGNNLGVKFSAGEYILFLNPDTLILDDAVYELFEFLNKHKTAGVVAPLLMKNENPYSLQGSKKLGVIEGIIALSFLNRLIPNNPISNRYFLKDWNKKSVQEVDVVPGTAFMIRRSIFEKIKGFDDNFFLFFEEFDLCKRVRELGYKIFIIPQAKVSHIWGASTRKSDLNIKKIFENSRFYYFKKHYGLISACIVEVFSRLSKAIFLLSAILAAGAFLRLYNLQDLMPFIGDQGWFYLSARDTINNGEIPLVGIASSHPWLHQGPLWTYMLAVTLFIFGFNPLNGAYLTVVLGLITILLTYTVGSELFSKRIGLLSSLLYATSPLAIIYSRTPYHTSPIPLFVLLFIFSLYKFIKGNSIFLPLSILFLSILYNFELATIILWGILLVVLGYGFLNKKQWMKKIYNLKNLVFSILAFLAPMTPILVYDFNNNFSQTLKFTVWIGYRILKFFGYPSIHGESQEVNVSSILEFSFEFYQRLIFAPSSIIALAILIFSLSVLFVSVYNLYRKKIINVGIMLLTSWIVISFLGYFINQTSSEAYLPIFFPALIFLTAFSFDRVMKINKLRLLLILIVLILPVVNSYYIIASNYFVGLSFSKRFSIAKEIVRKADGKKYNIKGVGPGSQFESFTMNYEYLTWWIGHPVSRNYQELRYVIKEDKDNIYLEEKN